MKFRPLLFSVYSLSCALTPSGAIANDSTAELAAGGLVMTRNAAIEMREEDLYVSEKEIRVRYRFFNTSSADIVAEVAFPMPDLPPPSDEEDYAIPVNDPENFLGFKTIVDGAPVKQELDQRAIANGVDQTALLKSLGAPLGRRGQDATAAIGKLSPADQKKLAAAGAVREEESDEGQGMKKHLRPNWTLRTAYHWRQTFPSKKELIVEHRYQPAVGVTAGTVFATDPIDPEALSGYKKEYCTDADFIKAGQQARKKAEFLETRIVYILTTGANWAAPIGDFRLVIDKGSPNNLVSFCAEGVKKIAPTQFEVRKRVYTPESDLKVLILKRAS